MLLVLISVAAIAGPVAGLIVLNYHNPVDMIIPPDLEEIVTAGTGNQAIELPKYVGSTYDAASRTVTANFNFTNPFEADLSVNSVSADVECAAHAFFLGHAELINPVEVREGATATISVVFTWTQTAENHFLNAHPNAESIDIILINLDLDVSGIDIQTPENISLTVPLVQ